MRTLVVILAFAATALAQLPVRPGRDLDRDSTGPAFSLFGSPQTLNADIFDREPDVAFDAASQTYLVVWKHTDNQILSLGISGQRFSASGVPVGSRITIATPLSAGRPRVANVRARGMFVVVWEVPVLGSISAASVSAATGAVLDLTSLVANPDTLSGPVISGEATFLDDDAILVWRNETANAIEATQVQVSPAGSLSTLGTATIFQGSVFAPAEPAISRSGGTSGRHLIAYSRFTGLDFGIYAVVVDRNLTILQTPLRIANGLVGEETSPAVDGDGERWLLAYEWQTSFGADHNIRCSLIEPGVAGWAETQSGLVAVKSNVEEVQPAVAWLGDSCVVVYGEEKGSPAELSTFITSLDPLTCGSCEGRYPVQQSADTSGAFRVASRRSAGDVSDEALLGFEVEAWLFALPVSSNVFVQPFRGDDGVVTDLGGGCGVGGTASAPCAIAGNAGFRFRLRGARSGVSAWLGLSASAINLPCGSCTLVPDVFSGFVLNAGSTDAFGDAEWLLPIPVDSQLVGARILAQWFTSGGACLGTDLSNAVRVVLQ